jgi:hypothetical protein
MKQAPDLQQAQQRMAPGALTMDGFLGTDRRALVEILQDDDGAVRRLGLTHAEIGAAMAVLTDRAIAGFGAVVDHGDHEVCACEAMGRIPCPFGHPGLYYKTTVEAENSATGETLMWSALQVHMVTEHGFYEGRGSHFRLEPETLARFLGLLPCPIEG